MICLCVQQLACVCLSMENCVQARVKADEERDRLLDLKVEAFQQRRQQKQRYLFFQHWILLAAERVSYHNVACAKLQKLKLQDQVNIVP